MACCLRCWISRRSNLFSRRSSVTVVVVMIHASIGVFALISASVGWHVVVIAAKSTSQVDRRHWDAIGVLPSVLNQIHSAAGALSLVRCFQLRIKSISQVNCRYFTRGALPLPCCLRSRIDLFQSAKRRRWSAVFSRESSPFGRRNAVVGVLFSVADRIHSAGGAASLVSWH